MCVSVLTFSPSSASVGILIDGGEGEEDLARDLSGEFSREEGADLLGEERPTCSFVLFVVFELLIELSSISMIFDVMIDII